MPETQTLEEQAASVDWFHSIELGRSGLANGYKPVVTKGYKSTSTLASEMKRFRFPGLKGKTVLDIGAWDGFFSFQAEKMGAERVVALDYWAWALDVRRLFEYWRSGREKKDEAPRRYEDTTAWDPDALPGKRGFDIARNALGSKVEACLMDFPNEEDPAAKIGTFDIVFFMGVLYHMENPLSVLRKVYSVTREVAIVESEAILVQNRDGSALFEFFPGAELNGDASNFWAPNLAGLHAICKAAGFSRVETIVGPPEPIHAGPLRLTLGRIKRLLLGRSDPVFPIARYRAVVHAYK